jgi:pimeloyl-ACP methyl ester carboxylesterase
MSKSSGQPEPGEPVRLPTTLIAVLTIDSDEGDQPLGVGDWRNVDPSAQWQDIHLTDQPFGRQMDRARVALLACLRMRGLNAAQVILAGQGVAGCLAIVLASRRNTHFAGVLAIDADLATLGAWQFPGTTPVRLIMHERQFREPRARHPMSYVSKTDERIMVLNTADRDATRRAAEIYLLELLANARSRGTNGWNQ